MTDEIQTPEPETEERQGITLAQLWAANYDSVLPFLIGNTLSKADKQQYRLKAADIAMGLTGLEARRFA